MNSLRRIGGARRGLLQNADPAFLCREPNGANVGRGFRRGFRFDNAQERFWVSQPALGMMPHVRQWTICPSLVDLGSPSASSAGNDAALSGSVNQEIHRSAPIDLFFEVELRRFVDIGKKFIESPTLSVDSMVDTRRAPRAGLVSEDLDLYEYSRFLSCSILVNPGPEIHGLDAGPRNWLARFPALRMSAAGGRPGLPFQALALLSAGQGRSIYFPRAPSTASMFRTESMLWISRRLNRTW